MNFFNRKADQVQSALREFNESNLPTETLPDVPSADNAVLGKDANLPLIVAELAPMQLEALKKERERITKRLDEIQQYEDTLHRLLDAVRKESR